MDTRIFRDAPMRLRSELFHLETAEEACEPPNREKEQQ